LALNVQLEPAARFLLYLLLSAISLLNPLETTQAYQVYTYSLIKNKEFGGEAVKLTNPVSLDFEYLRPSLIHNLKEAVGLNTANFDTVNLFEIGRVYEKDETSKTGHKEPYHIGIIRNDGDYEALKGSLEELLSRVGIIHPSFLPNDAKADILNEGIKLGEIYKDEECVYAELNFDLIEKQKNNQTFIPVSPYPASIEDLTFIIPDKTHVGQIIEEIKKTSKLISKVDLITSYQNTKTFRIYYQSRETTLTQKNVQQLREDILRALEQNLDVRLKK
jgi:phenylalanyl-tRNA synthetase beta subunit